MKIYNYDPEKVRNVGIGIVVQIFVSASQNIYFFLTISAHFFNFKKRESFLSFLFQKKIHMSNHVTIHKVFFKSDEKEEKLHLSILKSINKNVCFKNRYTLRIYT